MLKSISAPEHQSICRTGVSPVNSVIPVKTGIQSSSEIMDPVVKRRDDNNGHIVLFSDDDSFMRMASEDIVKEADDKIVFYSFENVEKLLDRLKTLNGQKVTVLTDQNMGVGLTGLELTEEIKRSNISNRSEGVKKLKKNRK